MSDNAGVFLKHKKLNISFIQYLQILFSYVAVMTDLAGLASEQFYHTKFKCYPSELPLFALLRYLAGLAM